MPDMVANWLLDPSGLTPHGFCLLWQPWLIWTHATSDSLIALAYFTIPLALARFARRRRDLVFRPVFWLFAAFILLCGITHVMGLLTIWVPAYGLEAVAKAATAVVSLTTAATTWLLLPRALALPSPAQMQAALDRLRDSERHARDLYTATPLPLHVLDGDGTILAVSDRWLDLLGFRRQDAVGQNISRFRPATANGTDGLARMIVAGEVFDAPQRYARQDGAVLDVLESSRVTRGADGATEILGGLVDITTRLRVEAALRAVAETTAATAAVAASEARLRSVVETAVDGIIVTSSDGHIQSVNPAGVRMFGYTAAAELLGHDVTMLIPDLDVAQHGARIAARRSGGLAGAIGVPGRQLLAERCDGSLFPIELSVASFTTNGTSCFTAIIRDVSQRMQREAALRESEARFRLLADNMSQFAWITDEQGERTWFNKRWYDYTGTTLEEMRGWGWRSVYHPDHRDRVMADLLQGLATGEPYEDTFQIRGRDGQYRWFLCRVLPVHDEQGRAISWFGTNTDVHDLREAQEALRQSEMQLRRFIDDAPVALAMFDMDKNYLAVSRRFVADFLPGVAGPADLIGRNHYDIFPEAPDHWRAVHARVLAGETLASDGEAFARANGRIDYVRWEMVPWRRGDGRIGGAILTAESLTDRMLAEVALRDSEARLRLVQQVGGIAYSDRRPSDTSTLISPEFNRLYGLPDAQMYITNEQWAALLDPQDRDRVVALRRSLLANVGTMTSEFRIRRTDGEIRWVHMRCESFAGPEGQPCRKICAHQDITEIVRAREALAARQQELEQRVQERTAALAAAEAQLRGIFDSQFQFIALLAPDGTILEANRTMLEAAGLTREAIVGRPFWQTDWWPAAEHDRLRQEIAEAAQGTLVRREVEVRGAGGRAIWIDFSLKPVRDIQTHAVTRVIAESRDLTEQRDLASQLAQAQKMQALGQLAGGIAHDFNNILQSMSGAALLIDRLAGGDEKIRHLAQSAIKAADRGESITRRLLSFARRGALRAEPIATETLIANMAEVLAHALGSMILVSTQVAPGTPPIIADQAQLETAIINLGTNARDAMPDGGTLVLAATAEQVPAGVQHPAGLEPGDYVRLSVTDDGIGMDSATLTRVSEPFFTTKPQGRGTGLGLAMVKGFAEQSGGGMLIASRPGQGTTVMIWLRQTTQAAVPAARPDAAPRPMRTASRILVVDDDDLVRETVAAQLEAEGFATLVAASGREAIALIDSNEDVDALVSDLSMPGMNGVDTILAVRLMRPWLPCFLLTGYVGERAALSNHDAFTLVRKPVAGRALAAKIAAGLEGGRR